MLWLIDSCQNKLSTDHYHVTISRVTAHRGRVFFFQFFFQLKNQGLVFRLDGAIGFHNFEDFVAIRKGHTLYLDINVPFILFMTESCNFLLSTRKHDKGPDFFFHTLSQLADQGLQIKASVLRERSSEVPGDFSRIIL